MSEKYEEIMDHIAVTDEMRRRILDNVRSAAAEPEAKVIRFPQWRKYVAAAACLAVLLIGALTAPKLLQQPAGNPGVGTPDGNTPVEGTLQSVECKSAAELSKQIGFPVEDAGKLPFEPVKTTYTALFGEIAEIDYTGADGQTAVCRKSLGTDDNSGNYDVFPTVRQITVDGVAATLKGDGATFTLAVWTDGDCAYSVALSHGVGADEWGGIIRGVS